MATRLENDRQEIDEIDAQIADLFERRFSIVRDIINYKIENRLPILDTGREKEIIDRNSSRVNNEDIRSYFRRVYTFMIDMSREYQDDVLREK